MQLQKIPNQIIRSRLKPLNLAKVDNIVLHHMAHATADVKTVERWHVNGNGWDAIGYNYWVGFDGTVYEGRGLHIGAGVANHNSHIVSIGFQGDYSKHDMMPDAQFNAGVELIEYLMPFLPNCKSIKGHRDFGGSVCPGKYFPLEEIKKMKIRTKELTSVNDIIWELAHRGIITNKELWFDKLSNDENAYWLARKCVNYIRGQD